MNAEKKYDAIGIYINCFSIFFALYPKAKTEVAISQIPPLFFNSDAKIEKMFCSLS
tara:strand:- start:824 stop:991 length:168 start_codon:yes stop_codon:yes gene_type:complete